MIKMDITDFDGYYPVFALDDERNMLQVGNYPSGAYWMVSLMPDPRLFGIWGQNLTVQFVALEPGVLAFRSSDGGVARYLSVDEDDGCFLRAIGERIGDREKFELIGIEKGTLCLKSNFNNKYCVAVDNGKYYCMAAIASKIEIATVVKIVHIFPPTN